MVLLVATLAKSCLSVISCIARSAEKTKFSARRCKRMAQRARRLDPTLRRLVDAFGAEGPETGKDAAGKGASCVPPLESLLDALRDCSKLVDKFVAANSVFKRFRRLMRATRDEQRLQDCNDNLSACVGDLTLALQVHRVLGASPAGPPVPGRGAQAAAAARELLLEDAEDECADIEEMEDELQQRRDELTRSLLLRCAPGAAGADSAPAGNSGIGTSTDEGAESAGDDGVAESKADANDENAEDDAGAACVELDVDDEDDADELELELMAGQADGSARESAVEQLVDRTARELRYRRMQTMRQTGRVSVLGLEPDGVGAEAARPAAAAATMTIVMDGRVTVVPQALVQTGREAARAAAGGRAQGDGARLVQAALEGDEAAVRGLVRPDTVNVAWKGLTPLGAACQGGHCAVIRQLLAGGALPHAQTDGALLPLLISARAGDTAAVTALLSGGAEAARPDTCGLLPLCAAAAAGHDAAVRLLVSASGGRVDVRQPADGATALMCAAGAGRASTLDLLLRLGADAEAADSKGMNAVDHAMFNKHLGLLPALRRRAAGAGAPGVEQAHPAGAAGSDGDHGEGTSTAERLRALLRMLRDRQRRAAGGGAPVAFQDIVDALTRSSARKANETVARVSDHAAVICSTTADGGAPVRVYVEHDPDRAAVLLVSPFVAADGSVPVLPPRGVGLVAGFCNAVNEKSSAGVFVPSASGDRIFLRMGCCVSRGVAATVAVDAVTRSARHLVKMYAEYHASVEGIYSGRFATPAEAVQAAAK